MSDLLRWYTTSLGRSLSANAELCGRTHVNLHDVNRTFTDHGIDMDGLLDYAAATQTAQLPMDPVPAFPAPSKTNLNFLKPGSREVLSRKVHINDYFPPMFPDMDDETPETPVEPEKDPSLPHNPHHPSGGTAGDAENSQNAINAPDHTHLQIREISSVMMTSSGFISPAREGKLPESRTPTHHSMKVFLSSSSCSCFLEFSDLHFHFLPIF